MSRVIGRASRVLAALLLPAMPGHAAAQCAIDVIESGVEAYRQLSLETTQQVLDSALALNARSASSCSTENATALVYLGASEWLLERPDEARRAFEQAVIQAPRFRPDPLEFPPDMTEAFAGVRSRTPSVALEMSEETVIGPGESDALEIRLTVSTTHDVTVRVLNAQGGVVRTPFRGPVEGTAGGVVVRWDGDDFMGDPVGSGRYELEVVSQDSASRPVRKVISDLQVESDAPVPAETAFAIDPAALFPDEGEESSRGVGKALLVLGAGLAGGAVIVAAPELLEGSPASDVRYGVAASVGVAGVIGFIQQMRGRDGGEPGLERGAPLGPETEAAPVVPTLRIRPGFQRREELGGPITDRPGSSGASPLGLG